MAITEGAPAPEFSLPDQSGATVRLSGFRGRTVVLYFYPKDDTPGCTTEACSFRDRSAALSDAGAVVLGVSPDGTASHERFARKYELPFPLLADQDHAVAEEYGVWVEKSNYGRKYMGIERSTFVIDGDGIVRKVFRKVKAAGHADEVLAAVQAL
jgi:peroxiredoxin Q/BCP